jgi:hypothetical protein
MTRAACGRWARATRCALALALGAGCRTAGSDLHLAPFYTRISTADGKVEIEALAGLFRDRRSADGALEQRTLGPFYGFEPKASGDWRAHALVPLGYGSRRGEDASAYFFPLFIWNRAPEADGSRTLQLAALPGLILQKNDRRGTQWGLFPFWGNFDDFVTFDRLQFVLFPLFAYSERDGRVSYNVLWPFFGWTRGGGEHSFRVFPLVSHAQWDGRYDRWFFLWPFFHYQRNDLGGGGEEPDTKWFIFPFVGKSTRGTFRAWTWMWPFFGVSWDSRSVFWALDFPFPLVRLQRGPSETRRTRFLPFYSYLRTNGLESRWFPWPIVNVRHEDTSEMKRNGFFVIPFWQSWDRQDKASEERSSWRKVFPLFQRETRGDWVRASFPTLDPFQRNEIVDRFYSWIWKVFEWEQTNQIRRERSWLGLWRREKTLREDRRSFAGLWSRRTHAADGVEVGETSLLFGLLRWRVTEGQGFDMLPSAFPGPGWPALAPGTEP